MTIPKAFISYSHDSAEHKQWVLSLATRLRHAGVDAILDQWELQPGDDIPHFMESNLAIADRVLMICSDRYVEKANSGVGGVGYEKMIVTASLLENIDSRKVIPIIRQAGSHKLPTFLKSKFYIDFSRIDQYEYGFDELARTLFNAPLFKKPALGTNPYPLTLEEPTRNGDGVLEIMKILVTEYEKGDAGHMLYHLALQRSRISRITFDLLLEDAVSEGLVTIPSQGYLSLTLKGKQYASHHKLI